jgi:hypothetical protein
MKLQGIMKNQSQTSTKSGNDVLIKTSVTLTLSRNYQSISRQYGMEKSVPAVEEKNELKRQTDTVDDALTSVTEEMLKVLEWAAEQKIKGE